MKYDKAHKVEKLVSNDKTGGAIQHAFLDTSDTESPRLVATNGYAMVSS